MPYKILLVLYEEDFKKCNQNLNGVEIIKVNKDIKPHKKYYYSMIKYRDYAIITLDDDIYYSSDTILSLYESYINHPNVISGRRTHLIKYKRSLQIDKYTKWIFEQNLIKNSSYDLFITTGAGALYPPDILNIEEKYMNLINEIITTDDIALKYYEIKKGIESIWVPNNLMLGYKIKENSPKAKDTPLYFSNILINDININKYIVFAKANNKTSYNIGLLQDGNYLIEEIKVFKKGEINEYALKMRNNFSGKIYRGVWGKDSKNMLPFLKNEIPENDTEFYISIDELINYFNSLYICKIHPIENGNEYFSEYIHYSKNEVNFPNIAVIDISKDTNIIIQFHQKNPKFNNINNNCTVTSYMIITDIDYEYIDSVSSVDSNYSIELNLKKGKYFLISDIIYRYIFSIDNYHGYTINTYSKEKINLLKNNENNLNLNINHKEIITNAVITITNAITITTTTIS